VKLPVAVRRLAYRLAFALLRVYWFTRRPILHGVKCVLTDGDTVLLVRHTYGPRQWDLPGGAVKRGEPPIVTASREMHEELGIQIDNWSPLGEIWASVHHARDTLHCYHASTAPAGLILNHAELAVGSWFARDRLPPDIKPFVPGIVALLDRESPGSA
jgi:8-oxo-dGTP pyrophosphatase MutT (NUDIX family)